MKWDERAIGDDGKPVRKAYFQDHVNAQELTDFNGMRMELREVGSWRIMGEAQRGAGHGWFIELPRRRGKPKIEYAFGKDQAIEILLREAI